MELDKHDQRMQELLLEIEEARTDARLMQQEHNGVFTHMHPDRLRAEGRYIKSVGKGALELVRLVPHIPELIKQRKYS